MDKMSSKMVFVLMPTPWVRVLYFYLIKIPQYSRFLHCCLQRGFDAGIKLFVAGTLKSIWYPTKNKVFNHSRVLFSAPWGGVVHFKKYHPCLFQFCEKYVVKLQKIKTIFLKNNVFIFPHQANVKVFFVRNMSLGKSEACLARATFWTRL